MAQYTHDNGQVFNFADGKLDFLQWIANDPVRANEWNQAGLAHKELREANNGQVPDDTASGKIFYDWMQYASAVKA